MIGIVDLGIGNINSIQNMLRKVGAKSSVLTSPEQLSSVERAILPGVGAFDSGSTRLEASGFRDAVIDFHKTGKPLLGICLGMQLLTKKSEEGTKPGLGLVDATTKKIPAFDQKGSKQLVPHMGWNLISSSNLAGNSSLQAGLDNKSRFYFVHSYYVDCASQADVLFITSYGQDFVSGFRHGNVVGVQFHPEKSHRFGMQFMKNFSEFKPC